MNTKDIATSHSPSSDLSEKSDALLEVAPPVDIFENDAEILLVADFPDVPNTSLDVRIDGSELLIDGAQADPGKDATYRLLRFHRAFRLPNTVDPGGIRAQLQQGVLTVRLAKSPASKPRRIEVTTA